MIKTLFLLSLLLPSLAGADFIFGNTTTGTATTGGVTTQERARATKFTTYQSGTVTALNIYTTTIPNTYTAVCLGIYAGGNTYTPTSLLAKSNTSTYLGEGWNVVAITDTFVNSGSVYWLATNSNTQNFDYHYNTTSDSNNLSYDFQSFPTALANPWSNGDAFLSVSRSYSIYATGNLPTPTPTPSATSWKAIFVGDLHWGTSSSQPQILAAIKTYSSDYSFIVSEGDNTDGGWNAYYQSMTTDAATLSAGLGQSFVPAKFVSAVGNHDLDGAAYALTNWKSYLSYQNSLGNDGKYFSFDYQNARFIFLDAFGDTAGAQANFLKSKALSNPKNWLFVVFHAPIFAYYGDFADLLNQYWGPIIRAARTDFVVCGHHHMYVRTKKIIFGGTRNPVLDPISGTVQLVADNNNDSLQAVTENYGGNQYALGYSYDESQSAFLGYTEIAVSGKTAVLKHFKIDGTVMDTETYTANIKPPLRKTGSTYNPVLKTGGKR